MVTNLNVIDCTSFNIVLPLTINLYFKRPATSSILLIAMFFFLLISCYKKKDELSSEILANSNLTIATVQNFYQEEVSKTGDIKLAALLKPQWQFARSMVSYTGENIVSVPTLEYHFNNEKVKIFRELVFYIKDNTVSKGNIVEFILEKESTQEKDKLISNIGNNKIDNFNGAILQYSLGYAFLEGKAYKNGVPEGKMSKIEKPESKEKTTNNRNPSGMKTADCRDVFWVTYYWDGSETWEYLYSYCNGGVETGGGAGGGYGGPPAPTQEQLDLIWLNNNLLDSTNNPCASGVIMNLKSLTHVLPDLFRNIFGSSANINITFKSANLGQNAGAETVPNYTSNNFKITMNTYYGNQTSLSAAATVLHEMIHAQLMDWYRIAHNNNDVTTQQYLATEYYLFFDSASVAQYPDLSFTQLMNQNQGGQHQIMTMANIRQQMSDALLVFARNVDPYTNVDALYTNDMAWAGTSDARGFKSLSQAEKDRLNGIIEGERGNNSDPNFVAKGKPCP